MHYSNKKELIPAKKIEDVFNYALWHLAKRDHSIYELTKKLSRKTTNNEWIEGTIKKLIDLKYLDDNRFVENFLLACNEYKNYGISKIKQELRLKGIDSDLINSSLKDSEFNYFESALETLNKKTKEPIKDKKEKERLTRYLLNRGYTFDTIRYAFENHCKTDN